MGTRSGRTGLLVSAVVVVVLAAAMVVALARLVAFFVGGSVGVGSLLVPAPGASPATQYQMACEDPEVRTLHHSAADLADLGAAVAETLPGSPELRVEVVNGQHAALLDDDGIAVGVLEYRVQRGGSVQTDRQYMCPQ